MKFMEVYGYVSHHIILSERSTTLKNICQKTNKEKQAYNNFIVAVLCGFWNELLGI